MQLTSNTNNKPIPLCPVCGLPTMGLVLGELHVRPCSCSLKRYAEQEALRSEQARQKRIQQLRHNAFDTAYNVMSKITFDSLVQSPQLEIVQAYSNNIRDILSTGAGLLLSGPYGHGKSTACIALANALIDQSISVRYIGTNNYINSIASHTFDRDAYLSSLVDCSVLILDDIDIIRKTSTSIMYLYELVSLRQDRKKVMITTTQLTPQQLQREPDRDMRQVYNIILNNNVICFDYNYINDVRAQNAAHMQKLLHL